MTVALFFFNLQLFCHKYNIIVKDAAHNVAPLTKKLFDCGIFAFVTLSKTSLKINPLILRLYRVVKAFKFRPMVMVFRPTRELHLVISQFTLDYQRFTSWGNM